MYIKRKISIHVQKVCKILTTARESLTKFPNYLLQRACFEIWHDFTELLKDDALQYELKEFDGLDSAPEAFIELLEGKNIGKWVIKVS